MLYRRLTIRQLSCCIPIAVLLLSVLAGCEQPTASPAEPPNILFISIDTLRRDHLGCYGYHRDTSPNIDALADAGTRFEQAISSCSWTLPSHASMLTGLYPAFHRLQDDGVRLPADVTTLAEQLRAANYHTLGVIAHVYVSSTFGLQRGFDTFDESLIEGGATNPIAEQVVDRFLHHMQSVPADRPYFAFVHFFDPHWDYTPPPPFDQRFTNPNYTGPIDGTLKSLSRYVDGSQPMSEAGRQHAIALYDGEIAYVDGQIGRMLDTLRQRGQLENTTIVLISDHGEEFREHGRLGHGKTLFGEQLRVPLIIAGDPAFPAGQRRSDVATPVDLAPTLLALAQADVATTFQGHSLLEPPPDRPVFAESVRFGNEMRSARTNQHKVIHYRQGNHLHYYDLQRDPREQQPLRDDPTGGELSAALEQYSARADQGWHLKLINIRPPAMRCRATITSTARLLNPRRYYSANVSGPSQADFATFELSEDGHTLTFDVEVAVLMASVAFDTDPPDAAVTFDIDLSGPPDVGVFLGAQHRVSEPMPLSLTPTDPRVTGLPQSYTKTPSGCYIRAVRAPTAPAVELSPAALERLRSLGYVGGDPDEN